MRVLVTGGAGFIGSAVCRYLVRDTGDTVLNLDKLTYSANLASLSEIEESDRYGFRRVDITDLAAVSLAFADFQPDSVIHLAAESHVDRSIDGPAVFVSTNIVGSHVMLQAALEHWRQLSGSRRESFRYLHVSTDEVFGSLGPTGLFDEQTPYDPRSPYAASKAASDHLAKAWGHTYGLPVLVSNCSNNYGPFHFPEKLIPLTILNALEGRALPVYGDGSNVRDWLYVDDHAHALRLILTSGRVGETYNVGGRNEQTNLSVVHAICDLLDELAPRAVGGARRSLVDFVIDRPGHDHRYAINPAKIESELGWRAKETFTTGLRRTVKWYLERRDWWEPLRSSYSGQRLGLVEPS
ncbi:MAG: dTDP-glucose 4,6-dehydratase [Caulobacter sp.]|nr:dTDP-glucose 4,6-dehydratase [Caulobacter sp.]